MKLSKIVLTGTLLLGSMTSIEIISPINEVKAAYSESFNDDWGI
ncbi:hypothetical protein ACQKOD_28725 [Bacillus mycoides]|uniref:Phr family secreted Rap phosphatase inhibitor n=1 Tax=Bacillus cereus HuA2-1 TaxID=1053201 RepID=J9C2W8_BACCE|nr:MULTISPECIES: hypothetical protein [Bacillus cereus group]EJV85766.1 hypothetical protein IG3_01959 [Bacillus cereus HuA2-1]EOO17385.1 hypothetical protein IG9_02605 [Bacillus cereus HuA2-9]